MNSNNPAHLHALPLGQENTYWDHFCIHQEDTPRALMEDVNLDEHIVDAMVQEDTRSRIRVLDKGIMVLLKVMHTKDGTDAAPEDMVSIRMWIEPNRVITTREADVDPIIEVSELIENGTPPETPGNFLAEVIERHLEEVDPCIEVLEDKVDIIQNLVANQEVEVICPSMAGTQSKASNFIRHLAPQRAVLEKLSTTKHPALSERDQVRFVDALDHLLRLLETLQNLRERLEILDDQIARIQDRKLNNTSYVFAVAATIFLPLGFITGLFGINLSGFPYPESPYGFSMLVLFCIMITIAQIAIFKWRKWL